MLAAGPLAEWLSLRAPLGRLRVRGFGSWAWTWHCSSGHAVAAFHIELERPTTRIYNYVLGLWGEKKKRRELATDVSSGPIFLTKKTNKQTKPTLFYNLLKLINIYSIPGSANYFSCVQHVFYIPEISSAAEI